MTNSLLKSSNTHFIKIELGKVKVNEIFFITVLGALLSKLNFIATFFFNFYFKS